MGLKVGKRLDTLADASGFCLLGEEDRRRLQALVLNMAEDILEFCERRGMTVMLGGGSCLGAVRHGGFIPWDDDMDLNMPRRDYQRFCREFPLYKPEKYVVQIPGVTKSCDCRMVQVRLRGTVARDLNDVGAEEPGIFIDVFPMDNVPNNAVLRRLHGCASLAVTFAHSCRRYYSHRKTYERIAARAGGDLRATIRNKIRLGRLFALVPGPTLARMMDGVNGACKNEESRFVAFPTGVKFYFGELAPRTALLPPSKGVFGGRQWCLPNDVDAYLSRLYGDYMRIPPEEERAHHYFLEFDFGSHLERANRLVEELERR